MNPVATMRTAALVLACLMPAMAQAWWDEAWSQRTRVTLNTGAEGVTTVAPVASMCASSRHTKSARMSTRSVQLARKYPNTQARLGTPVNIAPR
jgi:UDP-N-acetylmuramyl tripeptide synthase